VLILLDNNVPRGLARAPTSHTVTESRERGWATLKNGDLLTVAEEAGFEILVTSDKSIRYQQNLQGPRNRARGSNPGTLGTCTAQVGRNRSRRERSHARQLHRVSHPVRARLPDSGRRRGGLLHHTSRIDCIAAALKALASASICARCNTGLQTCPCGGSRQRLHARAHAAGRCKDGELASRASGQVGLTACHSAAPSKLRSGGDFYLDALRSPRCP